MTDTKLPYNTYFVPDDYVGDYDAWAGYGYQAQKPKCTCGIHITYGKDCDDSYHSDWCDVVKDKK